MPLISIVIPVCPSHNIKEILGTCLTSIYNQSYLRKNIELILIGDGCKPIAFDHLRGIKTQIYNFKEHVGLVKTRNKGICLSNGELIAFIDADCIAEKKWLINLSRPMVNENIGCCGGKVLDVRGRCINKDRIYGNEYILPFTGLGNALYRKKVLSEVGYLDEQFNMHEEGIDLSWRVCLKGYRIEYIPDAEVTHKGIKKSKDFFLSGIGMLFLCRKYKKLMPAMPVVELYKHLTRNRSLKEVGIINILILIFGYIYAAVKQIFGFYPSVTEIKLTDTYLQPAKSIKPLNIKFNSTILIKPNYVIWWGTENTYRIKNLANSRQYELADVSKQIWGHIMDYLSEPEISNRLSNDYDSSYEILKKDVGSFIKKLCKLELLIAYHAQA